MRRQMILLLRLTMFPWRLCGFARHHFLKMPSASFLSRAKPQRENRSPWLNDIIRRASTKYFCARRCCQHYRYAYL